MPEKWALWWRRDKLLRGELLRLAWPAIMEQILISAVAMVSTAMMGYVTTAALGAVGVVNMTIQLIQAALCILSMGVTIIVARVSGAGDHQTAVEATRQAFLFGAVVSVVLPAALLFAARPVLSLFFGGAEEDVLESGVTYFLWQLPGLPMFTMNLIVSGALRGAGQMRQPMVVALLVNVVFMLTGFVCIFGFWVIEPMGIVGAGLAMSIARTVGGVMMILFLFGKKSRLRFPIRSMFRVNKGVIARIAHVGIPAAFEQMAFSAGVLLVQIIMTSNTKADLAAYQIINSVSGIPYFVAFGFGAAAMTMVGYHLGAGEPDKAERAGHQALLWSMLTAVPIVTVLVLSSGWIGSLYSPDGAVISLVVATMPWLFYVHTGNPAANVMSAALRGAGDGFFVLWTNLLSVVVIRSGLTYLFLHVFHTGISAAYIAMGADLLIRGVVYIIRFRRNKWKTIRV